MTGDKSTDSRPFAAFDIDGTVVRWQLYHALADNLLRQGFIQQSDFEAVRVARMNWKRRTREDSFSNYEQTLVTVFESVLKGLPEFALQSAAQTVFSEYSDQVHIYTRDLIQSLKTQNYILFALSGSPKIIVEKFVRHYGFDDFAATDYPLKNGYYTGEKNVSLGKKAELLQALVAKHNLGFSGSLAVGDSEGDIAMLNLVETAIAFNPTHGLLKIAQQNQWDIVVERKNVVYHLSSNDGVYRLKG